MRITFLNQFYAPDLAATAGILASLAEHLAAEGHDVTVVTSHSVAHVDADHSGMASRPTVRRLWGPRFGKSRIAGRLIDYTCFYVQAFLTMLVLRPQDVVVSLTTPPYIGLVALVHRVRAWRSRIILWNMDCYPEVAEAAGIIREGGLLSRLLRAVNRWFMHRMDRIVCLDGAMENLLQEHYGSRDPLPTTVIQNWEPLAKFPPPQRDALTDTAGRRVCVLYQGNAGVGHEFETVLACARAMAGSPITFRFVGGGRWWPWLKQHESDPSLPDWQVRPYVPGDGGSALYADADIALITLRAACKGIMSPSKLHGCLASGLPILYIGPEGSNVDECIREFNCGASIRNGDAVGAAAFLQRLISSPTLMQEMSGNARSAFEEAYCDVCVLPRFAAFVTGCHSHGSASGRQRAADPLQKVWSIRDFHG